MSRLDTLQWRLIIAFILVVAVILAFSGLLVNRIFTTYMQADEASQFTEKVKVVADFLNYVDTVADAQAQLPDLQRLLGVNLVLVTDPNQPGLPGPLGSTIQLYGFDQPTVRPRLSLFGRARQYPRMQAVVPFLQGTQPAAWVLVERNEDMAIAQTDLNAILVEVSALGLVLSMVLAVWLGRSLSRPLRELTYAVEGMAEGDLGQSVPETGSLELQALARGFNEMSDRVRDSFEAMTAERDRLKVFIGDMSHELRTPLTALSTFNQLMLEGAGDDPATRREFLINSSKQIERLRSLSENLLQLSKLDSGLLEMRLEPSDLVDTVEESVTRLEPAARAKGLELVADFPEGILTVDHDPSFLQQAVDNLIGNAIKYTPSGGRVEVSLTTEGGEAVFRVRDNGPGIAPDDVPKLFQRFYRGRNQASEENGSGLGLAIVAAVVAGHHGTVEVSDPSTAEFTMRLPLNMAT